MKKEFVVTPKLKSITDLHSPEMLAALKAKKVVKKEEAVTYSIFDLIN